MTNIKYLNKKHNDALIILSVVFFYTKCILILKQFIFLICARYLELLDCGATAVGYSGRSNTPGQTSSFVYGVQGGIGV